MLCNAIALIQKIYVTVYSPGRIHRSVVCRLSHSSLYVVCMGCMHQCNLIDRYIHLYMVIKLIIIINRLRLAQVAFADFFYILYIHK